MRSPFQQREAVSRRSFENLIEPWVTQDFESNSDYGIDKVVQIFNPAGEGGFSQASGKYFFLQLKSTSRNLNKDRTLSYAVKSHKISEWYHTNVPVLLVVNHLSTDAFYVKWIDDHCISCLDATRTSWRSCDKVMIRFSPDETLTSENKIELWSYVLRSSARDKRIKPGQFFELQSSTISLLKSYEILACQFSFRSIFQSIELLSKSLESALYRIALTGQSRVGKSSIINALIAGPGRKVTPTGFFQTTGLPIQIVPGKTDQVAVRFQSGKEIVSDFDFNVIEQYASQQLNEDNYKRVSQLTISLCNEELQKGVSFFDIPGLDDPDDATLDFAWNTLRTANVIVYVIDASVAKNGGYIFSKSYKNNLEELYGYGDKVILVFNKADELPEESLLSLKERVEKDLTKHKLREKVHERIFYVSAEKQVAYLDGMRDLREELWTFMLKENKFGLNRLVNINEEISNSIRDFQGILHARLLDSQKKRQLESNIESVKGKLPELVKRFQKEKSTVEIQISRSMANQKQELLSALRCWLESIQKVSHFPGSRDIKNFLLSKVATTFEVGNAEYCDYFNSLKVLLDDWMENNLQQVREILDRNGGRQVDITEVSEFTPPNVDLSSIWGSGIVSAIIGLVINPWAAIGLGIWGAITSYFATEEGRRREKIDKIMKEAEKRCGKVYDKIERAYKDLIHEDAVNLGSYAQNKLNAFFEDLSNQITELEPAHEVELAKHETAFDELQRLKKSLDKQVKEIGQYL